MSNKKMMLDHLMGIQQRQANLHELNSQDQIRAERNRQQQSQIKYEEPPAPETPITTNVVSVTARPSKTPSDKQHHEDKQALAQQMGWQAGGSWYLERDTAKGDLALSLGLPYVLQKINPRKAMEAEKNWNTNVGLAFDLSPEGELMGDPAGFKAMQDRRKKGQSIEFYDPTLPEMRAELFRKLGISESTNKFNRMRMIESAILSLFEK